MNASKKTCLSTVPESLPQVKTCRKAPLPRSAVKPPVEQAALLWHEAIQALLVAGKVPLRPTTTLAISRDLGRHEDGGGEQPSTPDAKQLVGRLQALIIENEVAAKLAVQAVTRLSWEQLQNVQVVLDKMGFELLSDFLHVVAYNSSDPFVKLPLGGASAASAHPWAHRSDAKRGAQIARQKDQARDDDEQPAPPLLNHIWKADLWREQQQHCVPAPSDVAKYAQILAGKHWHAEPASAAEATGAVAGSAGTRASVSGQHQNTWQRASMLAGAHRASVLQRFGAPRESVVAALPAALSPDITPTQAPTASTSGVHHHSYTAFDGRPGGAFGTPLAAPATPTLDAIFLAKGPGLYPFKGAQGVRSEISEVLKIKMQKARQAAVALEVRSSNVEQGTATK